MPRVSRTARSGAVAPASRSAIGRVTGAVSHWLGQASAIRASGEYLRRNLWAWPIVAAILFPLVWLVSLPIRLVVTIVHAALALVAAIVFLPARLLGWR